MSKHDNKNEMRKLRGANTKQNFAQTITKNNLLHIPAYNNGVHMVNHLPGCSKVAVFLPAIREF